MDADDISEPSRLERQSAFLFAHDGHVLIGTDVFVISENGEILYRAQLVTENTEIQHSLDRLVTPFYYGAVMFRRDAVISCGLYDERITQQIEDILLWLRLRHFGLMANLPESLYRYRFRANSF
jgi:GT2 family glycosyltransferase